MKNSKKILAIAIAFAMMMSMSLIVYADGTTTISTTVPASQYTLVIPADQSIEYRSSSTDIGILTVTDSSGFAIDKNLKVTIEYTNFSCPNTSTTIPYKLVADGTKSSTELSSGSNVYFHGSFNGAVDTYFCSKQVVSGTITDTFTNLLVKVEPGSWGKVLAGEYTSTITFTSEVVIRN